MSPLDSGGKTSANDKYNNHTQGCLKHEQWAFPFAFLSTRYLSPLTKASTSLRRHLDITGKE